MLDFTCVGTALCASGSQRERRAGCWSVGFLQVALLLTPLALLVLSSALVLTQLHEYGAAREALVDTHQMQVSFLRQQQELQLALREEYFLVAAAGCPMRVNGSSISYAPCGANFLKHTNEAFTRNNLQSLMVKCQRVTDGHVHAMWDKALRREGIFQGWAGGLYTLRLWVSRLRDARETCADALQLQASLASWALEPLPVSECIFGYFQAWEGLFRLAARVRRRSARHPSCKPRPHNLPPSHRV